MTLRRRLLHILARWAPSYYASGKVLRVGAECRVIVDTGLAGLADLGAEPAPRARIPVALDGATELDVRLDPDEMAL